MRGSQQPCLHGIANRNVRLTRSACGFPGNLEARMSKMRHQHHKVKLCHFESRDFLFPPCLISLITGFVIIFFLQSN